MITVAQGIGYLASMYCAALQLYKPRETSLLERNFEICVATYGAVLQAAAQYYDTISYVSG